MTPPQRLANANAFFVYSFASQLYTQKPDHYDREATLFDAVSREQARLFDALSRENARLHMLIRPSKP
jgi:hypothetical protein